MTFINKGPPNGKPISLEKFREMWLRQIMADPQIQFSDFKVAAVIGFHMNRNKGGRAWPGIRTIARIACVDPRTVMRSIRRLEACGHVHVTRARKGKRNLPNQYLPALKKPATIMEGATPRGIAVSPPRGIAVSPEPYTEPLSEPHTPISISAAVGTAAALNGKKAAEEGSGNREGNDNAPSVSPSLSEQPDSPEKQAYHLARDYEGELGASRVARALQAGSDPGYVLADVEATVSDGGDLGESLAYHWKESW